MNRKEAEETTGLSGRENMKAHYEYLRCCLGRKENVLVQTSAFRTVPQTVFRLIAFGETWDRAVSMWESVESRKKSFRL